MHRLKKKTASSLFMTLHTFSSNNGMTVDLEARIMSGRLYYSIIVYSRFNSASYYDGNSFDDAFDLYIDMMIAFKGLGYAEETKKQESVIKSRANKLLLDAANISTMQRYKSTHKKPLFLGITDPV